MNKEVRIPALVFPDGKPVCPVEIDVDSLSSEKQMYRYGGWEALIQKIATQWVEKNSYTGTGTIWGWETPSINFHRQSYSAFYAVLGMPKNFRKYLGEQIEVLGEYVRAYSDYVVPSEERGWAARCHIEDGKVWMPVDDVSWQEVKTEEDEEDVDGDGDEKFDDVNQDPEEDIRERDRRLTNAEIHQMMHADPEADVHDQEKAMTDQEKWVEIIQQVAEENSYTIEKPENRKFYIYIDRWNAVAYQVWNNTSSGYIEVSQWEGSSEEMSSYGRGVYSIRSYTDVIDFCSILVSSASIRARRRA